MIYGLFTYNIGEKWSFSQGEMSHGASGIEWFHPVRGRWGCQTCTMATPKRVVCWRVLCPFLTCSKSIPSRETYLAIFGFRNIFSNFGKLRFGCCKMVNCSKGAVVTLFEFGEGFTLFKTNGRNLRKALWRIKNDNHKIQKTLLLGGSRLFFKGCVS